MSSEIVTYEVDSSTTVKFEVQPTAAFRPAGPGEVLGRVQDAVIPAIEAAKIVLDKVKEMQPEHIEVKFGIKASGEANWLVAKAAGEGNFEITLAWSRHNDDAAAVGQ